MAVEASFVKSSPSYELCPAEMGIPEYAFIGRSNVGKSSLINALTQKKDLAKTSSKPGKTQLINHFLINQSWYLVDLPGYGYAKVSKTKRAQFSDLISGYLLNRTQLINVFLLIDSRIPAQKMDLEFIEWLGENSIPFTLLFTKTDKVNAKFLEQQLEDYFKILLQQWETLPSYLCCSALTKNGIFELHQLIESINIGLKKGI